MRDYPENMQEWDWPENRMDLAVEHFFLHDKANGGIVSLDADCTVSKNFLSAIRTAFLGYDR